MVVVGRRGLSDAALSTALVLGSTLILSICHSKGWIQRRKLDVGDDFQAGQGEPAEQPSASESVVHVPYHHQRLNMSDIRRRSQRLAQLMSSRRTLRFFARDRVPREVIENILQVAASAPSGAHRQPWSFLAVQKHSLKQKIRELVEEQETINYQKRMRSSWVDDVQGMVEQVHSTDSVQKPYLTDAPWLIIVMKQTHGIDPADPTGNKKLDHYYVSESVGIACGMLCTAIHNANLVTLTSTPMGADAGIRKLLNRPSNERVFLLLPVGFPAADATVPYRSPERKPSNESTFWY